MKCQLKRLLIVFKDYKEEWREIIETVARETNRTSQMVEKDTIQYTQNASGRSTKDGHVSLWDANQAAERYQEVLDLGFDAVMSTGLGRAQAIVNGKWKKALFFAANHTFLPMSFRTDYAKVMRHYYVKEDAWENVYPTLMPQWDRTPRAGVKTDPLINSTPEKFQATVEEAIKLIQKKQPEHQILCLCQLYEG